MFKLMTDSMVSALEKVEKRNGRIPLSTLANGVTTSSLHEAKYPEMAAGMSHHASRPNAPAAPGGGNNPKKKGDPSVNGVSADFLKQYSLCINFNKGKCQVSGSHMHPFIMSKFLFHQCGACKKAGKADSSHASHELDRCPNKQVFRRM